MSYFSFSNSVVTASNSSSPIVGATITTSKIVPMPIGSGNSSNNYSYSHNYAASPNLKLGEHIMLSTANDSGVLKLSGSNAALETDDGTIDLRKLKLMMDQLAALLLVVKEEVEKNEKYPALKNAYEHYTLIRSLVRDEDED